MKTLENNHGIALTVVLMIMAIMLSITGAGLLFSGLDLRMASTLRTRSDVFYLADAGLNHAWQELNDSDSPNFQSVLSTPGGVVDPLVPNTAFGPGSYRVRAEVQGSQVKLISTACIPAITGTTAACPAGFAKAVIEAKFGQNPVPPGHGLTSGGGLRVSGNPDIKGTCGAAHSNGAMEVSGNPNVQVALTSSAPSNQFNISGNPCVGSETCVDGINGNEPASAVLNTDAEKNAYEASHSNQPQVSIPTINPAVFADNVATLGASGTVPAYILNNDGTVTQGGTCNDPGADGVLQSGESGLCAGGTVLSQPPTGWEWTGTSWKVSGNSAANGIFYVETDVKISGNPGSAQTPWQATIIARDSIEWSGNPYVRPFETTDPELQDILLITGNDLKISGNVGLDGNEGAIMVHQQISISGNATINGFVMVGDGEPTWSANPFPNAGSGTDLVSESQFASSLSGNPVIKHDCNAQCRNAIFCPSEVKMAAGSWVDKQ